MPKAHLTDITVRSLKPPDRGQATYWDDSMPGFGCRISQGGTKSFVLMHGVNRQLTTIGRYPTLSLAEARRGAKRLLAERTLGKNQLPTISFSDARDRFLSDCAQKNSPRTVYDYTRLLERHFRLGNVPLSEITTEDIMRRVNKLSETPSEQNHAFVAVRAFFRWAVRHRYLQHNPLEALTLPAKVRSRERVLNDQELAAVYGRSRAFPFPHGPIVSLLLLTGQRKSEIGSLRWEWIDEAERTVTLPSEMTKNRHSHTFPYGDLFAAILSEVPRQSAYLFPAARAHVRGQATTVFNGWAACKREFDKPFDFPAYRLHDLRRTFSSRLAALGTPLHVTERLLNHRSGAISGVAAIYNRHSYMSEMRDAISVYEQHLENLLVS